MECTRVLFVLEGISDIQSVDCSPALSLNAPQLTPLHDVFGTVSAEQTDIRDALCDVRALLSI